MTTRSNPELREKVRRVIQDYPHHHGLDYGKLADAIMEVLDPSAPTYPTRLEFDQLAGEVRVQRAQLDEMREACRRNGVWVD